MTSIIKRLYFKFRIEHILLLLFALLTIPAVAYLPIEYSYENSLIENTQLAVLALCIVICLMAKVDKKFYRFMALACVILILREVNCGRTIFFPVEGEPNEFYSWKEIPYGYLAHPLFGLFIASTCVYFFVTKSYKVLWKYMLDAKIVVWTWFFAALGIAGGLIGEKISDCILEEMTETLFYCAFVALIYFHAFDKGNDKPAE